jgi:hypothetical protein
MSLVTPWMCLVGWSMSFRDVFYNQRKVWDDWRDGPGGWGTTLLPEHQPPFFSGLALKGRSARTKVSQGRDGFDVPSPADVLAGAAVPPFPSPKKPQFPLTLIPFHHSSVTISSFQNFPSLSAYWIFGFAFSDIFWVNFFWKCFRFL